MWLIRKKCSEVLHSFTNRTLSLLMIKSLKSRWIWREHGRCRFQYDSNVRRQFSSRANTVGDLRLLLKPSTDLIDLETWRPSHLRPSTESIMRLIFLGRKRLYVLRFTMTGKIVSRKSIYKRANNIYAESCPDSFAQVNTFIKRSIKHVYRTRTFPADYTNKIYIKSTFFMEARSRA